MDSESFHQEAKKVPFVPFIGWSEAAARFRELAAAHAPGGITSVLFLGPRGVGKRTMAQAWQYMAGATSVDALPIVSLDGSRKLPESCIATSVRPLPQGLYCSHLGKGAKWEFPAKNSESDAIDHEVASRFELTVYMPPLCERELDILALLHFFNKCVLPIRIGGRFRSVSTALLFRMLFQETWMTNGLQVLKYLTASAYATNGLQVQKYLATSASGNHDKKPSKGTASIDFGHLETNPDLGQLFPGMRYREWTSEDYPECGSEDQKVLFDQLPDMAVSLYHWKCEYASEAHEYAGFLHDEMSPLSAKYEKGILTPRAEVFRQLTVEKYVCDHLPLCAASIHARDEETRSEILQDICDQVRTCDIFGTTFSSLQNGVAIAPEDVPRASPNKKRSKAKRNKGLCDVARKMTPMEKEILEMAHVLKRTQKEIREKLDVSKQYVSRTLNRAEAKMAKMEALSRSADADEMPLDSRGQSTVAGSYADSDPDRAEELDLEDDRDRNRRKAKRRHVIKKTLKDKE